MNNKLNLEETSLEIIASELGINYQTIVIKSELVYKIKEHCIKKKISQRQLAKIVPGLTQDRVSKIFSGQIGHMTIDKLISVLTALDYEIQLKTKSKQSPRKIKIPTFKGTGLHEGVNLNDNSAMLDKMESNDSL